MAQYMVLKPLTLKGKRRNVGEILRGCDVDKRASGMLLRSGYLAEMADGTFQNSGIQKITEESIVTIPIDSEKGFFEINTCAQNAVTALIIMQKTVDEAVKAIAWVNEPDTLILLNACDSRKGVQKAAEERNAQLEAKEVESGESAGEA